MKTAVAVQRIARVFGFEIEKIYSHGEIIRTQECREETSFLWPRLAKGGRLYTHEATSREYIYGITEDSWWWENLNQCPPLLIKAGYGCGPGGPDIVFMEKH